MQRNYRKERRTAKKVCAIISILAIVITLAWCSRVVSMGAGFMVTAAIPLVVLMALRLVAFLFLSRDKSGKENQPTQEIDPWDRPQKTHTAPESQGFCPYCGFRMENGFTFCPKCGRRIP